MKIISQKLHAVLDYLTVIFLIAAPSIIFLSANAGYVCYFLAIVHLLLTITTNFNGGLIKIIPFSAHGLVEFFIAIALGISAFTSFRINQNDQWLFTGLAVVIMIVFLLTDYKGRRIS